MYATELMVMEHENILKLLEVVRKICCGILEGKPIEEDSFRNIILFARNYADKHHHGKEEQILFREMLDKLGALGQKLVQHGMLVEHDLGRLHISELEKALDAYVKEPATIHKANILAEAMGYASLLERHIYKENHVVYPFAEKNLSQEVLDQIDDEIKAFEDSAKQEKTQQSYLDLLEKLEDKYL